jgi:hypothetical protein
VATRAGMPALAGAVCGQHWHPANSDRRTVYGKVPHGAGAASISRRSSCQDGHRVAR